MIFGKKVKDDIVENDMLGQITPRSQKDSDEQSTKSKDDSTTKLTVDDLKSAIKLQQEQVDKIKQEIKKYDIHFDEYEKAKTGFEKGRNKLFDERKRYLQVANRTDITPKDKEDIRKVLKDIDKDLLEIKELERKNEKFIREIKLVIKESEKAIKTNERAISQNLESLKIAEQSDNEVEIQSKDIKELKKQIDKEDLIENISTEEKLIPKESSENPFKETKLKIDKIDDDDYWERGKLE